MTIQERIKNWWFNRKTKKQRIKEQDEARQQFLAELETKIDASEQEIAELQKKKDELDNAMKIGIDSTEDTRKKTTFDKIRKLRTEIVVQDHGRDKTYRCETDGYFLRWREGIKKQEIIIATRPREHETEMIPIIWYRRSLRYYVKKGEKTTHYPNIGFKLPQAKYAMDLVDAVTEAKTFQEMAKATKGTDRKQLMMWLIAIIIIAIAGIAGTGGYFK